MIVSKFNRALIAVAIAGLLEVPTVHAVDESSYVASSGGSLQISGQRCKSLKLDDISSALSTGGGLEGDGRNTGDFTFQMFLIGDDIDDDGPLIASDSGRTLRQDSNDAGYDELEAFLDDFINGNIPLIGGGFNDGCDAPVQFNFGSLMINRYETRFVNNQNTAKLRMDAEGTYEDANGRDRKLKLKIRARMNILN